MAASLPEALELGLRPDGLLGEEPPPPVRSRGLGERAAGDNGRLPLAVCGKAAGDCVGRS